MSYYKWTRLTVIFEILLKHFTKKYFDYTKNWYYLQDFFLQNLPQVKFREKIVRLLSHIIILPVNNKYV